MVENGRWAHFAVMVLALLAVATVAGYFPAWKPSKVDPDSVLRGE